VETGAAPQAYAENASGLRPAEHAERALLVHARCGARVASASTLVQRIALSARDALAHSVDQLLRRKRLAQKSRVVELVGAAVLH
jgi:hypothetical protein